MGGQSARPVVYTRTPEGGLPTRSLPHYLVTVPPDSKTGGFPDRSYRPSASTFPKPPLNNM